jgi:hypothetical protein
MQRRGRPAKDTGLHDSERVSIYIEVKEEVAAEEGWADHRG